MAANHCQEYLRMQIQTASREKLVLMLFDGVLRFCEQAESALARKDFEASHQSLIRCQDIILELAYGLDREKGGDIAANLARLYAWCLHCLVRANMTRTAAPIEEVKRVFRHLREGWQGAMEKLKPAAASASGEQTTVGDTHSQSAGATSMPSSASAKPAAITAPAEWRVARLSIQG
ncbi:MAG: flagellar export chaperone FliS [Planctomycetota bacterium]|nr:flagellar export chaperone FliS [Planctomycetota bacterium]